ncbi:FecR domain-containing protein [Pseudorhodoferax sp.]|uniref:FecR domain-containing protein n=1 Tax=Pseudorhodoferax sp. TaxID=1993553 RepID=UPI0039E44C95
METGSTSAAAAEAGRLSESLIQAAIGWSIRLHYNRPSPRDRQAFERWLQADPLHGVAWQRVSGLKGFQSELKGLPPQLASDALQAAQGLRDQRAAGRRHAVKLLAWGSIAVATGWLARAYAPWQRVLADASTGVGEQKTLRLGDGTVLVLNTDSAVGIDLSGGSRLITLRRGEILVTTGVDADAVAHQGAKRPFWVQTPFGRMQALGTRFTVRLDDGRARVSVQQGSVALHPVGGTSAVVPAGESRWLMEDGTQPAEVQGFGADDWAEGVIAGRNIRLQDLLAEMARYRHGRIVCDPRVADLRVSGLFHIRDTDQALQFLIQTQPVSVTYLTRWWVMVRPRETAA